MLRVIRYVLMVTFRALLLWVCLPGSALVALVLKAFRREVSVRHVVRFTDAVVVVGLLRATGERLPWPRYGEVQEPIGMPILW